MKLKLPALKALALLLFPFIALTPGCNGPDNPKIADAPAPPPPKPEELKTREIKAGKDTVEYGSHSKYKKAMDRLEK
jgi:hypothetical protein